MCKRCCCWSAVLVGNFRQELQVEENLSRNIKSCKWSASVWLPVPSLCVSSTCRLSPPSVCRFLPRVHMSASVFIVKAKWLSCWNKFVTGLSFSIFIIYFCDVLYVDIISIVIVDKLHMRIKACTSHCVYICCINSSSATYLPFGS